jgi:hypothetical protein
LDIIEVKSGKQTESNDRSIYNSDDEIFYEDYHINGTLSDDETNTEEEDDDDYHLEHEDL